MIDLMKGDCLDLMSSIPDGSVDMILCDLPYGITACKWDSVIPFEPLWAHYKRVIKPNGAIVLFGSQPFTSALVMSNVKWFKYNWIWEKTRGTNYLQANKQPLKYHEDICLFYNQQVFYAPIKTIGKEYKKIQRTNNHENSTYRKDTRKHGDVTLNNGTRMPKSIIKFNNPNNNIKHPTQKPVALLEYLIKTYSNEGETVLDNCMGSGSTGVACINTNRSFIGIELDAGYFEIAQNRINEASMLRDAA